MGSVFYSFPGRCPEVGLGWLSLPFQGADPRSSTRIAVWIVHICDDFSTTLQTSSCKPNGPLHPWPLHKNTHSFSEVGFASGKTPPIGLERQTRQIGVAFG